MAFEDAIYTRNSHYSYEIKNNRLRLFPNVVKTSPSQFWVEFFVDPDPWDAGDTDGRGGGTVTDGINNLNSLPYENLPYENINSIGKQWIRRFALSLSKETLGTVRSKFGSIPIPGESVTLDGKDLVTQSQTEQKDLREELKTILDELTYTKLMEDDAKLMESVNTIEKHIPLKVYVG
jgi:Holliday junction resolvase RusA-like endonuclease